MALRRRMRVLVMPPDKRCTPKVSAAACGGRRTLGTRNVRTLEEDAIGNSSLRPHRAWELHPINGQDQPRLASHQGH